MDDSLLIMLIVVTNLVFVWLYFEYKTYQREKKEKDE